jgi:hypothetical protein
MRCNVRHPFWLVFARVSPGTFFGFTKVCGAVLFWQHPALFEGGRQGRQRVRPPSIEKIH